MSTLLHRLVRDESGQDLAEYGIALAVIGIAAALAAIAIANKVNDLWSNANSVIQQAP